MTQLAFDCWNFALSRSLTMEPLLLFLDSCRLQRWYGLECKFEFQNFSMYILRPCLCFFSYRGSEVNATFTWNTSLFWFTASRWYSSFIVLRMRSTSSVFSGVVNQWKPPLLWAFLTWSLLLTFFLVRFSPHYMSIRLQTYWFLQTDIDTMIGSGSNLFESCHQWYPKKKSS